MSKRIMFLIRTPLSRTPVWEWLGPDWSAGIVTHPAALDTKVPDHVEVFTVGDFDSPQVEALVLDQHRHRPLARLEAFHERDLLRAARLREHVAAPGASYSSTVAFRDKVVMKDGWSGAGVAVTDYTPIEHASDLLAFAERHAGRGIVVKPRLEAGSRGVSVLRGRDQVDDWLERTWRRRVDGAVPHWMAELYVEGRLLQVDGLVRGGRVEVCWPTEVGDLLGWNTQAAPGPVLFEMLDPADALVRRARSTVIEALRALPTPELTAFHAELWETPTGELVMNEVGARVGGALTAPMFEAGFGLDLHRRLVECALEPERTELLEPQAEPRISAGFALIPRRPGLVTAVEEVPEHIRRDWLLDLAVHVRPGSRSAAANSSVDAAAHCLVIGADRAEMSERLRRVADFLHGAVHYRQTPGSTAHRGSSTPAEI